MLPLNIQGSTLRPVGSPMRLDLVCWRLTFHFWSPVWPPRFQVIILFLFIFSFPKIHDGMNECGVNHEEYTNNAISYQFQVQSRLGTVYTDAVSFAIAPVSMTEISYIHVWL